MLGFWKKALADRPFEIIFEIAGAIARRPAREEFAKRYGTAGLLVHIWTFRPENRFLAADFRNGLGENVRNEIGSIAEMRPYIAEGIDGFFTDDPGLGRAALS